MQKKMFGEDHPVLTKIHDDSVKKLLFVSLREFLLTS